LPRRSRQAFPIAETLADRHGIDGSSRSYLILPQFSQLFVQVTDSFTQLIDLPLNIVQPFFSGAPRKVSLMLQLFGAADNLLGDLRQPRPLKMLNRDSHLIQTVGRLFMRRFSTMRPFLRQLPQPRFNASCFLSDIVQTIFVATVRLDNAHLLPKLLKPPSGLIHLLLSLFRTMTAHPLDLGKHGHRLPAERLRFLSLASFR